MGKTTTAAGGGGQNEGRRRRRQKLFVDRLIEDVAKVDFAAPAPAYLENDLGQSNVRRYLLEPGPKDGSHSRCRIVRKKDAFGYCTYVLYAVVLSSSADATTAAVWFVGSVVVDARGRRERAKREKSSPWTVRGESAVRGQEEEKIEKVNARSRFSTSNVCIRRVCVHPLTLTLTHTHSLSLDVCASFDLSIFPGRAWWSRWM